MADPVFAFLQLSQDDAHVYAKYEAGAETPVRALYDAVKTWFLPRTFDETTVKIEKVLSDFNEDLPGEGYVFTAAATGANQYWCEHAPVLLLPPVA